MIGLHDHEKRPAGGVYCPLMKELCYDGWTPSMGESKDERKLRPTCVRWIGVFVNDPLKGQVREVFDCSDRWTNDMLQQVAQETFQGAKATEEVRNRTTEAVQMNRVSLGFFQALANRMRLPFRLPEPPTPKQLDDGTRGNGHAN